MTTGKLIHAEPGARPSADTKRIYKWANLKADTTRASFLIENEGIKPFKITVSLKKRQVLEGLMQSPIMAASYCRISDQVLPLRRDYGVNIVCTIYKNDPETGRETFGVYTLVSKVTRILSDKEAA
ncbi:hypothetical protein [Marivita sp.]|uniref:hypothetical protein n=1 Tax=Marivita sp. TaxID=2003365 RepID=UPI003F6ED7FD